MLFRSPSLLARRVLAATAIAAAAGAVLPATANADVTPTTLVNGVLSTVGGCQTPSRDAILACTRFETLTTQFPVVLDLNPFGTNIVALGAGLFPNGTMRPVLESRMQATLQVAHRYPLSPIIVSGGVPQNGITESRAMRDWLIGHGIPAFRITEDYTSRSTVEKRRGGDLAGPSAARHGRLPRRGRRTHPDRGRRRSLTVRRVSRFPHRALGAGGNLNR
jgi:hypothetical protein